MYLAFKWIFSLPARKSVILICSSFHVKSIFQMWPTLGERGWFLNAWLSIHVLTTSLSQPVQFLGWKMHESVCKQYTFQPSNTSTFNAMRFDKTLSHASVKKKTKKVNGFRFRTLHTRCDTTLIADVATGVEDFYFREQKQTVIKPRFYPRLCQFLMKMIPVINW